jgi:hypothetical protein
MTNRLTILTRTGLFLAAATLTAGLAFAATPIASAEWDIGTYDACEARTISSSTPQDNTCCSESDGRWNDKLGECVAPPEDESGDDGTAESGTGPATNPPRVIRPPVSMAPNHGLSPQSHPLAGGPIISGSTTK